MTNDELDRLLKSVRVPMRADEFWKEFPKRMTAKIHWQEQRTEQVRASSRRLLPKLGLSFAAACIVIGFIFGLWRGHDSRLDAGQLAQARKYYNEIETLFPNQVQAIVFDRQGPHLILANRANVPNSPPFYVKVCGPKGCEGFVTFSGQQIKVNGENCEVLADDHGRIMLVGNNHVWSANQPSGSVRVEAKPLTAML